MFGDEKAEWIKFFDFYQKKFKEEVGLVPSVFENDDFEVDLAVGEDSGKIHGIRVMQIIPYEEEEGDEEDEEENDNENENEEDEDEYEMICYDFVKTKSPISKLEGKPYFDLNFKSKTKKKKEKKKEDDIDLPLKIQIYSKELNDKVIITGAVMINSDDPEDITVLMENTELG